MIITDERLASINAGRASRGLPPLTKQEAIKLVRDRRAEAVAQSNHSEQSSDFLMHFLIGYGTGFPLPSAGGIIGAMMHPTTKPDSVGVTFNDTNISTMKYGDTSEPERVQESTRNSESSYSSSSDSSSSSSDSGSSSSSDSGSSGGGGGE
jgi:uncharacterized membrane protein YgcG